MVEQRKVFKPMQNRLIGLLRELQEVATRLHDPAVADLMGALAERVGENSFKVLVLGPFDAGKTTLVNALLGVKVLPTFYDEATAIPCEVKYAAKPSAKLYPRDGSAPFPLPPDQIAKHLVVPADGGENKYRRAELFWPLDLCSDGEEIVDSPGLDATDERDKILVDYLRYADAVIVVSRESAAFRGADQKFLKRYVFPLGHAANAFYVINWTSADESDRERVFASVSRRLAGISTDGQPPKAGRMFIIDAKRALDGQLAEGNTVAFETSGMPEFRTSLQRFLIQDKGRIKLRGPAEILLDSVPKLRGEIENQRRMYGQKLSELTERYEAEKPKFAQLERRRKAVTVDLNGKVNKIVEEAGYQLQIFLSSNANQFSLWASQSQPGIKITSRSSEEEKAAFTDVIRDTVKDKFSEAELEWQRTIFRPLLEGRLTELEESIHFDIERFFSEVRDIRGSIAGPGAAEINIQAAIRRVLADAGEPGAYTGLTSSELTTPEIMPLRLSHLLRVAPALIAALHPFGALLVAPITWWLAGRFDEDEMKRKIGNEIREDLEQGAPARISEFKGQLASSLKKLYQPVDDRLAAEIRTIKDQAETVIRNMRVGQQEISRSLAALDECSKELDRIQQSGKEQTAEIDQMT